MIRKPTWILVGIFVVLAAAALIMNAKGINIISSPTTPTATPMANLLDPNRDVIQEIKVETKQYPLFQAKLGSDGKWTVEQPPQSSVTDGQVTEAIIALNVTKIAGTFDTPLSLKDVGIEAPTAIITLGLRDGRTHIIRIGNTTPTGSGYYLQLNSNPAVVVEKASLDPVFILANPPPTPTPTPAIGTALTPPAGANITGTPSPSSP